MPQGSSLQTCSIANRQCENSRPFVCSIQPMFVMRRRANSCSFSMRHLTSRFCRGQLLFRLLLQSLLRVLPFVYDLLIFNRDAVISIHSPLLPHKQKERCQWYVPEKTLPLNVAFPHAKVYHCRQKAVGAFFLQSSSDALGATKVAVSIFFTNSSITFGKVSNEVVSAHSIAASKMSARVRSVLSFSRGQVIMKAVANVASPLCSPVRSGLPIFYKYANRASVNG